jgi:hypothetical protein
MLFGIWTWVQWNGETCTKRTKRTILGITTQSKDSTLVVSGATVDMGDDYRYQDRLTNRRRLG